MKSMTSKVLGILEATAARHNLETTVSKNWSNTGILYITKPNSFETVSMVKFWIYEKYATFDATTYGVTINTGPRGYRMDNCESVNYENHTEFEDFLKRLVTSWNLAPELVDDSGVIDSVAV